ncbi:MAG: hypothetical protein CMO80_18420 [Verrucomicrobiales bacterium]|nr:hypothetical protein [Verrucomicrobiales bacterium]|tara:strand:- start:1050 stop:1220 length:171 start_codon:yes stop_codon:yes gene_type:complete
MDLKMPRLDGFETFTAIRQFKPGAKVLMMSGYDEKDRAAKFSEQGPRRFYPETLRP